MSYLLPARVQPTRSKLGLGFPVASRRRFGIGRLGDDFTPADDYFLDTGINLTPTVDTSNAIIPNTLIAPGNQLSTQQAYQNLLTTQQNSTDPLDYVSPQAAIAAGLPASQVNTSWSTALAKFSTQSAALAAGIAPAVVTQYWAQSRSALPAASSTSSSTLLLIAGGVAVLALALRH